MSVDSTSVVLAKRTPDDIAFELTTYRDSVRANLQSHFDMVASANARDKKSGFTNPTVLRILDSGQHYFQNFIRTKITPSTFVRFSVRRPLAVGIMAGAAVGAVMLIGPARLLGWAAKAAAAWRLASAIRSR